MDWVNLILFIVTLIIGFSLIKLISNYVEKLKQTKKYKKLIKKTIYDEVIIWYLSYFIKLGGYIITILIAISFLGYAQQALQLIAIIILLSIIGVLVYSLRDLIPSAFAGAYITKNKLIKKGDKISVDGFKGTVKEITLLTTNLTDKKGSIIIIPNKIITEKILKKKKKNK